MKYAVSAGAAAPAVRLEERPVRKPFIDNMRWIAVLFLFPYHAARIFDGIQPFYIKGPASELATDFVLSCTPWFMPLLFVVAGVSTRYALRKRSRRAYIRERFAKLLVPVRQAVRTCWKRQARA